MAPKFVVFVKIASWIYFIKIWLSFWNYTSTKICKNSRIFYVSHGKKSRKQNILNFGSFSAISWKRRPKFCRRCIRPFKFLLSFELWGRRIGQLGTLAEMRIVWETERDRGRWPSLVFSLSVSFRDIHFPLTNTFLSPPPPCPPFSPLQITRFNLSSSSHSFLFFYL